MRSRHCVLGVTILVLAGNCLAQEKRGRGGPETAAEQNTIEVRFADDSTVKMVLQTSTIDVVTRYGRLTVPVNELRRIEFGLRIADETTRKIDEAVAGLGSPDIKKRDAASNELLGLRELAYPALRRAAGSSDPEIARRARDAMRTLAETVAPERLNLPPHDTIVTAEFTIVGRVEAPLLKARSKYFGEAHLKLAELRMLRFLGDEREVKLSIDAARYGLAAETWMDTGLEVRGGSGLQIVATGAVELRPGDGLAVGPDGRSPRSARGGPGGGFAGGGAGMGPAGGRGGRGMGNATMSSGALLGRIGENGRVFMVGSRFDSTTLDDGRLYLRIAPNPDGSPMSGAYNVRLGTRR